MMGITGAFSSLGINERPENTPETKKIPKNSSTISLPNLVLTDRPNFIRNLCDDEIEATEQPVDFSKKYCETKVIKTSTYTDVVKNFNSFTMYAETDLDQPTDYSLRYAEDDSDSDQCNKLPKSEATEFVQDTIKTYCTEDTPYETPFNFSTSTSMSDLRIDEKAPKLDTDTKDTDVTVINTNRNKIKSEFSSGLMSPEKPVNYCEEGTPGYFSRVASCGSLNSLSANDPAKQESKDESPEGHKKELRRASKFPAETKAVKFEEVVNYAEETPLMFSRSSSLASLDSIEQHSIHDDRSSVVSDFSRLTSGVISPSELPDSPSQTVPPSPKPRKNPIVFPPILKKKTEEATQTVEPVPKLSVFEDVVKKFKMESTPLEFSTATSLSSLLLDDEIDSKAPQDQVKNEIAELSEDSEDEDILAACINIGMQSNRYSQPTSNSPPASEVPSSYKFSQHSDIVRLTPKSSPQHLSVTIEAKQFDTPVQKSDITSDSLRTYCTEDTPAVLSHAGSNSDLSILSMHDNEKRDLNLNEQCEPEIGNVGSNQEEAPVTVVRENGDSNTSRAIEANCSNHSRRSSFSSLSDDSHESEQALLQECILAGMPKSAAIITGSSTLPDVKKEDEIAEENDASDDDEDANILADCMSIGMKINRYSRVNSQEPEDDQLHGLPQSVKISPPEDDEDANILAECISKGMQSNRYTQPAPINSSSVPSLSRPNNDVVSDNVKSYFTEDTPAILSHAGSCSNLSVLSMQDMNSTCSDEEERLLEDCVRYGMPAITGKISLGDSGATKEDRKKADVNFPPEDDASSYSDDSFESEQALLQQCIQAGMPKRTRSYQDDSNELTPAEKALLQQCILEGMKKCCQLPKKPPEALGAKPVGFFPKTKTSPRPPDEDSSELTEAEQALLRQCILSGMPKNKNLTQGGPSGSRDSTELTEGERLLLQQCILAGMPKSRNKLIGVSSRETVGGVNRQWWRRPKEGEKNGPEHTCCIHCPRNGTNRGPVKQNGHVKTRRRYRERDVQVRETRDVNILYVTSRILTMKKEIVDRSHEKWV